jgi:hypothetical protein
MSNDPAIFYRDSKEDEIKYVPNFLTYVPGKFYRNYKCSKRLQLCSKIPVKGKTVE